MDLSNADILDDFENWKKIFFYYAEYRVMKIRYINQNILSS